MDGDNRGDSSFSALSSSPPAAIVDVSGRPAPLLIPPHSQLARAVMGNEQSSNALPSQHSTVQGNWAQQRSQQPREARNRNPPPASNLTVLMAEHELQQQRAQQQEASTSAPPTTLKTNDDAAKGLSEADSACGFPRYNPSLGSSAPPVAQYRPTATRTSSSEQPLSKMLLSPSNRTRTQSMGAVDPSDVRRCISSKELKTLAPPSGSPYATMLVRKEQLEESTRRRLQQIKSHPRDNQSDESTSNSSARRKESGNESRNKRRTLHNQAIVDDLCEVVADLFLSESKLLSPVHYGVSNDPSIHTKRDSVVKSVQAFVSALPTRYALGVETPSEVLLHMRLMATTRADRTKAAVHIHNMDDGASEWTLAVRANGVNDKKLLRLVTISCRDVQGLLEHITKALASGGSRVLDADVMLSTDRIVLNRFVVEMRGRLRLDKLAQLIEDLLKESTEKEPSEDDGEAETAAVATTKEKQPSVQSSSGPLYFNNETEGVKPRTPQDLSREIEAAVPLSQVLASGNTDIRIPELPRLRKMHSMPQPMSHESRVPSFRLQMRPKQEEPIQPSSGQDETTEEEPVDTAGPEAASEVSSNRRRRPLVDRRATPDLGIFESESKLELQPLDYVTVPNTFDSEGVEDRAVPLIPFEELMLIETIGTGRVSTIYRAAWQRASQMDSQLTSVHMVALKVAMVNTQTGDNSQVDELRREADIAARIQHVNICDLVGVAADSECFCLAYDFCEGGSLLSLLSDSRRYYEYLPIALDIANGMAYLHSKSIIHRDLKPSNILLTRDHRAKIADFGMSVAFYAGQELTAETGTYRYMAPEVIRHESYSSNADVYSFGVVLWQLITREVPFGTMTPIQAAYAVAEGRRPQIPPSTPRRLQEIIEACWDQDSYRRPSFTYITMALADYAKMAFSPANVGALTLQIANEMLAHVDGNSTVNVDFTAPVMSSSPPPPPRSSYVDTFYGRSDSINSDDVGLEI